MDLLMWVVAVLLVSPCLATDYTVGDSQQWESNVDYTKWVSGKTFAVNDKLTFKYTTLHSVLQVNKAAYDSCQTGNALKTYSGGSTTVTLSSAGNWYFICGTPGHCNGGMKLAVDVKAATSTTPSPSSSGSPSTSPSSTTPTTEPSSKSPAGNNSAATSSAVNGFLALTGAATVAVLLM